MSKNDFLKFIYNMPYFGIIRFQEFASCRDIEKKIFNRE